MEKAYIILAHKNIEQLIRLIKRLDDNSSTFFIHLDKKWLGGELPVIPRIQNRIHWITRIDTKWAGFSLVQATLNAMHSIKASGKDFDVITLLSGQDYPVKSNSYINSFFRTAEKKILMEYFKMPNHEKWSPGGGMYRLNKYFFGFERHQVFLSRLANFLGHWFPFLKRNAPTDLTPYGGSQWWTIDMYALNYILEYVKNNPAYSNFHRGTFAPDELFFQTILLNAADERIRSNIAGDNKRFIRWKSTDNSHPEILQEMDFHDIIHSDALFARKLDLTDHPGLFDLIDAYCLKKKTAGDNHPKTTL